MSRPRVETPRQLVPLPAALVDELARGHGGAEAVRHLARFQQSLRHRLLAEVCAFVDAAAGVPASAAGSSRNGSDGNCGSSSGGNETSSGSRIDGFSAGQTGGGSDGSGGDTSGSGGSGSGGGAGSVGGGSDGSGVGVGVGDSSKTGNHPTLPSPLALAATHAVETLRHLDADARCHAAVADVLAHPCLRTWAVRLLEQRIPAPADLAHLAAIAGAAAIRAGADADVAVPVRHGAVHLPTLGRLVIAPHQRPRPDVAASCADCDPHGVPDGAESSVALVDLRIRGGSCSITAAPGWQAVRAVPLLGLVGGALAVEDTDPYRAAGSDAADRIPREEWEVWRRTASDAWDLLRRDHPRRAAAMAAGLSTLVPLGAEADAAAAAWPAFGSVAAALVRPDDPEAAAAALAVQLVGGFQRATLAAVLDVADLHDPADPHWPETLWQDAYAGMAVTDFWRVRSRTAPDARSRDEARAEFVHGHGRASEAVRILAAGTSLTALGRRFADALGETLAGWASREG